MSENPTKVMLVDDSAVVRGFITRILDADPDIKIVYSAQNGQMAVNGLENTDPDIILLDVEMPIMDGLTAIPLLLAKRPKAKIIMCSTLTAQNATTALKAMELGAVDCIGKPTTAADISQGDFKELLLHKIKSIGEGSRPTASRYTATPQPANTTIQTAEKKSVNLHPSLPKTVKIRPIHEGYNGKPAIIAIGSSTGGPNALFKVIAHLKNFDMPIVVTQHMPPTFTKILAEHIATHTGVPAVEAQEGMKLEKGRVHVAAGGKHMLIVQQGTDKVIKLDDGPMENFCKPAVDPMLRSLIPIYGEKILTIILTGMGQDGMRGCRDIIAKGGRVIAQDEATSVVWGMPGAVALDGSCSAVLPLEELGPYIRKAALK